MERAPPRSRSGARRKSTQAQAQAQAQAQTQKIIPKIKETSIKIDNHNNSDIETDSDEINLSNNDIEILKQQIKQLEEDNNNIINS